MIGVSRPMRPETRAKLSAAITGHHVSIETRQKLAASGRLAYEQGRSTLSVLPDRHYTKLAQALHMHLSEQGLTLEPEVKFGRFSVDLYDREHHIAYEADGAYWHDKHEARHPGYAAQRDDYLIRNFGLKVVHFSDKEISALTGYPKKKARVA
jgi:very-short-patch-repair endonuclease